MNCQPSISPSIGFTFLVPINDCAFSKEIVNGKTIHFGENGQMNSDSLHDKHDSMLNEYMAIENLESIKDNPPFYSSQTGFHHGFKAIEIFPVLQGEYFKIY